MVVDCHCPWWPLSATDANLVLFLIVSLVFCPRASLLEGSLLPEGHRAEHSIDLSFAFLTLPVLFLARALNIFPLTLLANRCRPGKRRISLPMQVRLRFFLPLRCFP